jgi:hypothetical protein
MAEEITDRNEMARNDKNVRDKSQAQQRHPRFVSAGMMMEWRRMSEPQEGDEDPKAFGNMSAHTMHKYHNNSAWES